MNFDAIPGELRNRDQWVCWREEERDGDTTKVPVNPHSGGYAKSDDPDTWGAFEKAREYYEEHDTAGVGFMFDENGTVAGVDLDDVRDPDTGEPDDVARDVIERLDSYTEVSPSGTGYHIYVHGFVFGGNKAEPVEMYDSRRFFTVTGNHVDGTPETVEQRAGKLQEVHSDYVADDDGDSDTENAPSGELNAEPDGRTEFEAAATGISLSDARDRDDKLDELLRHLEPGYNLPKDDNSPSGYDLAAASKLYFWGFDRQQIGKILRTYRHRSKLDRDDYLQNTIEEAWGGERYEPQDTETDGGTAAVTGSIDEPGTDSILPMNPQAVRELEGLNDDEPLAKLPARDRAYSATRIITSQPSVHIASVEPDNKFFAVNDETVWVPEGENVLRKKLQKTLNKAYQQKVLNESKEWIMGRMGPDIRREDLGAPEWKVPVANGLLDLKKVFDGHEDPLRELMPEDFALNRIKAPYDPNAEAPTFEQYLSEVCRDQDIPKLQEYAGYTLFHWGQPFKKAMALVGPTDSGKSTFTKLTRALIGPENVASQTLYDLISTKWGTAQLFGNMVNIRNELTSSELKRPERFKEITGGEEQIDAERKGEQKFQFIVTQKFLFSTNDVPKIDGADPAFYNRWLFASFPNTIPAEDQDPDLYDEIVENELAGVLNWALEGLGRLLESGQFTNERGPEEKKQMWEEKSGLINRFKSEILDVTGDDSDTVAKSEVHDMLAAFADYVGKQTPTQNKLTRELKKDGNIGDKEQSGTRYFTGIQIAKESIGGRKPLDSSSHKQDRF